MDSNNIPMKFYRATGNKTIQNNNIPECSGVYFLWSKYELLYIGKSKNLRIRIAQHFSNGIMTRHTVNPDEIAKVSIIFTKDEFDALRLEEQLINLIPTKWNKNSFYKKDWYHDWKFGEGLFKDKQNQQVNKGEIPQ